MTALDLEEIDRWHVLFDELCNRAGFHDAASLAGRYCDLTGGSGQKAYEAALRNLNNWRAGRHLPRLRSVKVLAGILEVDRDPVLLAYWSDLYRQASEADGMRGDAAGVAQSRRAQPSRGPWSARHVAGAAAAGALLFVLGVAAGNVWASGWRPWGGPADHAPVVVYRPEVAMSVGESKVIHAERGDCGRLPRHWQDVAADLPSAVLGVFSDGGLARRNSKFCRGLTPARAIVFTARRAGVEEFVIQGDFFKMTVAEPDQPGETGS